MDYEFFDPSCPKLTEHKADWVHGQPLNYEQVADSIDEELATNLLKILNSNNALGKQYKSSSFNEVSEVKDPHTYSRLSLCALTCFYLYSVV